MPVRRGRYEQHKLETSTGKRSQRAASIETTLSTRHRDKQGNHSSQGYQPQSNTLELLRMRDAPHPGGTKRDRDAASMITTLSTHRPGKKADGRSRVTSIAPPARSQPEVVQSVIQTRAPSVQPSARNALTRREDNRRSYSKSDRGGRGTSVEANGRNAFSRMTAGEDEDERLSRSRSTTPATSRDTSPSSDSKALVRITSTESDQRSSFRIPDIPPPNGDKRYPWSGTSETRYDIGGQGSPVVSRTTSPARRGPQAIERRDTGSTDGGRRTDQQQVSTRRDDNHAVQPPAPVYRSQTFPRISRPLSQSGRSAYSATGRALSRAPQPAREAEREPSPPPPAVKATYKYTYPDKPAISTTRYKVHPSKVRCAPQYGSTSSINQDSALDSAMSKLGVDEDERQFKGGSRSGGASRSRESVGSRSAR